VRRLIKPLNEFDPVCYAYKFELRSANRLAFTTIQISTDARVALTRFKPISTVCASLTLYGKTTMTLKKLAIAVLVAILCVWYYATPYLAFSAMKAAADKKDAQALSEYVDYPAVRESLKATFKAKMAEQFANRRADANPFAALSIMLAGTLVDTLVDAMITPQGLANLMSAEQAAPKIRAPSKPQPETQTQTPPQTQPHESKTEASERDTVITRRYAGWNRFEISVSKRNEPDDKVTMVMTRQGIARWKLSAIDLQLK